MFSATGNNLSGSTHRPDIYTVSIMGDGSLSFNCTLNKVGHIPGISTITGCGRALLGVVHSIVHLVSAIFDSKNRGKHLEEAKLGGKNIGRGLIEMIPVIGNITMFVLDRKRAKKFEKQAEEVMKKNPDDYKNQMMLFGNGKEIAKRSLDEVKAELSKLPNLPKDKNNRKETVLFDIIQNKA